VAVARAGMGITVKRLTAGPLQRPWGLAWRPEVDDAAQRPRSALLASGPGA
jgi:hypothetical protein